MWGVIKSGMTVLYLRLKARSVPAIYEGNEGDVPLTTDSFLATCFLKPITTVLVLQSSFMVVVVVSQLPLLSCQYRTVVFGFKSLSSFLTIVLLCRVSRRAPLCRVSHRAPLCHMFAHRLCIMPVVVGRVPKNK